jgi:glycosyltransferase 2 family protein
VRGSKTLYIAVSLILSGLLLGILFTRVDVDELFTAIARIHVPALIAYMGLALAGAILRAWRYALFLAPEPVRGRDLLLATFVRNSFVDLLPARIGSLSIVYVLIRRMDVSFEKAASAFLASMVYDFLTLGPFLALAVAAIGGGGESFSGPGLLAAAGIFFAICLVIQLELPRLFGFAAGMSAKPLQRFKDRGKSWAANFLAKIEATKESLEDLRKKRRALPFFALSLGIRGAKYASIYFLLFAILRHRGFALSDLSIWMLIVGITGAELTSVLPVKGLAGFGTWESAWALTFGLMGFDPRLAVLSGLGVHLVTNVFEYTLGISSLIILASPLVKRRKET